MNVIDEIIESAERELGVIKSANDRNGAPSNPSNINDKGDIVTVANSFLQELEQFKQTLAGNAAAGGATQQTDSLNAQNPEGQNLPDPNLAGPVTNGPSTGITVQTPGGSVVKIASLVKLASLKGSKLFKEAK